MDVVARLRVVSDLVDIDPRGRTLLLPLAAQHRSRAVRVGGESTHLWEPPEDLESPATRAGRGLSRSMLTARDVPTSDWTRVRWPHRRTWPTPRLRRGSGARDGGRWVLAPQVAQACAQLRGGERWRRLLHDNGPPRVSNASAESRRIRGLRAVWRIGRVPGHVCHQFIDALAAASPPADVGDTLGLGACSHAGP